MAESALRLARTYRSGSRSRARTPYAQAQYYDDIGTTLTPDVYEAFKEEQAELQAALAESDTNLSNYKTEIDKAQKAIDDWYTLTGGTSDTWSKNIWRNMEQEGGTNVDLVRYSDGKGNITKNFVVPIHTMMVHDKGKTAEESLQDEIDIGAVKYLGGNLYESVSGLQGFTGKFTIDSVGDSGSALYTFFTEDSPETYTDKTNFARAKKYEDLLFKKFMPELVKKLDKQLPEEIVKIGQSETALNDMKLQYESEKSNYEALKQQNSQDLEDIRNRYSDMLKNMNELYGGINFNGK